jgi:cell division septation protein DedD
MKKLMILLCSLGITLSVHAQNGAGKDSINRRAGDSLRNSGQSTQPEKEVAKKAPTAEGFRVQVYSGNSRQMATQVRSEILDNYPQFAAYLSYRQPNFRVRVGDFRQRKQAQELLDELKPLYPSSFIVPDEVLVNPVLTPKIEEPAHDD